MSTTLRKIGEQLAHMTFEETERELKLSFARLYLLMYPEKSSSDFISDFWQPLTESTSDHPAQIDVPSSNSTQEFVRPVFFEKLATGCAYSIEAGRVYKAGDPITAYRFLSQAMYFLGLAEGLFILEPAIGLQIEARGKAGASKRDAKYEPLRKLARDLAVAMPSGKPYPSKRNAALLIKDAVLAKSKELGIGISDSQAERTITKWLEGISFGSKE